MESKAEKLKRLRERRQQNNALERARVITKEQSITLEEESAPETKEQPKKARRIFDTYKTGNYYSQRSMSKVDIRNQSVQTDPGFDEEESKRRRISGMNAVNKLRMTVKKHASTLQQTTKLINRPERRTSFSRRDLEVERPVFNETEERFNITEMLNEKREKVLKSDKFNDYFFSASKFVEKVLRKDLPKHTEGVKMDSNLKMDYVIDCPASIKNSVISVLNWSYLVPEVFLSVYIQKSEELGIYNDKDKIYIWNTNFVERPEFELISPLKVETAIFSPFSSNEVISGCQSGRICLYDLREKKEPVKMSMPSTDSHRSSITGIECIGSRNANNIITVSEEGRLCVWSLANLEKPVRKIDLHPPVKENKKEENFDFLVEPFALSSIQGDTAGVYIGGVDGNIYQCAVLSSGSNYQTTQTFTGKFEGHKSIVNTIHHQKTNNLSSQLSGLMLSGSFDWSMKLWSTREKKLLYDFKSFQDPITDVNWCFNHPAMFASGDSSGNVKVFNLFKDFDQPVYKTKITDCVFNTKWDHIGETLATTDSEGKVHIKKFKKEFFDFRQTDIKNFEMSIQQ